MPGIEDGMMGLTQPEQHWQCCTAGPHDSSQLVVFMSRSQLVVFMIRS